MTILTFITGGTGRLGSTLVDGFRRLGHKIVNIDLRRSENADINILIDLTSDFDEKLVLKPFNGRTINQCNFIHAAGIVADVGRKDWVTDLNMLGEHISKNAFYLSAIAPAKLIATIQDHCFVNAVFISSIYGTFAPYFDLYERSGNMQNPLGYGASKAAEVYSMSWLNARYEKTVRINTISPGGIESPSMTEDFKNKYRVRTRTGQFASEIKIMNVVEFLCSEASSQIVNENIHVADGYR